MTVEHLFTMCGGMDYNINTPAIKELAQDPNATTVDLVNAMAKTPLRFEPGTNYCYSLCHDVLAAIVEVVSGMSFGEYLQKNIFDPLEMEDIAFRPTEEQKKRFSALYRGNCIGTAAEIAIENVYMLNDRYESGGAGLFTKPDTYIKFLNALSLGGTAKNGYCLLREETVKLLQENRLCETARKSFGITRLYGYGWGLCGRVHIDPIYSMSRSGVGEFGWDGAAGAFALADPKKEVALYFAMHVMGCNYSYHYVQPTVRNLIYDALGI
jgi:CubicO group peptidase (beta-lactamase class C family)